MSRTVINGAVLKEMVNDPRVRRFWLDVEAYRLAIDADKKNCQKKK